MAMAWAFSVVPAALQQLQGRTVIAAAVERPLAGLPAQVARLAGLLVLLTAALVLVAALRRRARPAPWPLLLLLLAPWMGIQASNLILGGRLGPSIVVFPLVAVALWTSRPPLRTLSTVGWLTSATAAASLTAFLLAPSLVSIPEAGDSSKALWGSLLLAGPFAHPNTMGVAMVLGLPTVTMIRQQFWRRSGYTVTLAALALTASRTSWAAAAVGVLVVLAVTWSRRMPVHGLLMRGAGYLGVLVAIVGTVWLPLSTSDPSAFTERGRIWLSSLDYFRDSPWFGQGPDFYSQTAHVANTLGPLAFHGHNLFVHMATTGGLVALTGLAVFAWASLVLSARWTQRSGGRLPIFVVTVFFMTSWLEVVTDFRNLSSFAYCSWMPLALVFFSLDQEIEPGASHSGGHETISRSPGRTVPAPRQLQAR